MPPPPPSMRPLTGVGAPNTNTTVSRPPSAPPQKRPPPSLAGGNNYSGLTPSAASRPPSVAGGGGKGPASIPGSPRPMGAPIAPPPGQNNNGVNAVGPKSSPPPVGIVSPRPPSHHTPSDGQMPAPQSPRGVPPPPTSATTSSSLPKKALPPPQQSQQPSQNSSSTTTITTQPPPPPPQAKVTSSYHICPFKARDHRVEVMFEVGDGRLLMRPSEVFAHSIGHADELHLQSLADPEAVGGPKSSSRTNSENRMPSINYADYLGMVSARDGSADVAVQRTRRLLYEYLSQTVDHQINMEQIWVRFEPGEIKTVGLGTCGRGTDSIVGENAPRLHSSRKTNPVLLRDCNWPLRVYAQVLCAHQDAAPIMSSLQQLGLPLLPPPYTNYECENGTDGGGKQQDVTCRAYQEEWLFDRFTHHLKGAGTASLLELEVLRAQGYPHNSKDVRDQQRSVKKRQLDASGATIDEVDKIMSAAEMGNPDTANHNHHGEDGDVVSKRRSYYTRRRKLHEKLQNGDDDTDAGVNGDVGGGMLSRTQSVISSSASPSQKPTESVAFVSRDCFHNRASVVFFDLLKFLQERTKRPVFQHARVNLVDTGRLRRTAAQQPDDENYDFDVAHGCNAAVRMPAVGAPGTSSDGATLVFSVAPRKERSSHRTSFYSHDVSSVTPLMEPVIVHTGVSTSAHKQNSNTTVRNIGSVSDNTGISASHHRGGTDSRSPPFQNQHSYLAIEDNVQVARHGSNRGTGGDRPAPSNVHLNGRCQHNFNARSASAGRSVSPEVAAYQHHHQHRNHPVRGSGVTQADTRYAKGGMGYSVLDVGRYPIHNHSSSRVGMEPFHRNTSSDSRRADIAGEVQVIGVRSLSAPRIRPGQQHYRSGGGNSRW